MSIDIDKTIYFVSGLPRSGSTLLMNILGQNPEFYVTPTSGIVSVLIQARNDWDRNEAFRAMPPQDRETMKINVLRGILNGAFAHTDKQICIDKNRNWLDFMELAAAILGDRTKVKVLVTVRDMRDVVASFEKLHRETAALGRTSQEAAQPQLYRTALGRLRVIIDDNQPVGRAYNAIRDAVTRGWLPNMHFIEYGALTGKPQETMDSIYNFLGQKAFKHDFDHVDQITVEDDTVYGFKDLHLIRQKVEPQKSSWPNVFDRTVTSEAAWKQIERHAQFWRAYMSEGRDAAPSALSINADVLTEDDLAHPN